MDTLTHFDDDIIGMTDDDESLNFERINFDRPIYSDELLNFESVNFDRPIYSNDDGNDILIDVNDLLIRGTHTGPVVFDKNPIINQDFYSLEGSPIFNVALDVFFA